MSLQKSNWQSNVDGLKEKITFVDALLHEKLITCDPCTLARNLEVRELKSVVFLLDMAAADPQKPWSGNLFGITIRPEVLNDDALFNTRVLHWRTMLAKQIRRLERLAEIQKGVSHKRLYLESLSGMVWR